MKNFKELKIWQNGIQIALNSYRITDNFPKTEKWGLALQINKAAVSISSNIAEGSSRTSDKDNNRFIEISLGSCFEMETQLLIAEKVNFGDPELIAVTLKLLTKQEKMLSAFSQTLLSKKV